MTTSTADPFDSLLSLEDQYHAEGYSLGVADGSRAGRIEGRLFGLEKGFSKAVEMGRLNGRAAIWNARLPAKAGVSEEPIDIRTAPLPASERLRKQIDKLVELTDPESLETKNTEEAVNEFDERLAGAKAKTTLIEKMVNEDDSRPSRSAVSNETDVARSAKAGGDFEDFKGLPQASRKSAA